MAKADIWMPFYVADYLADTTRLTTEQHGAYMLLILDYWRNGPPPNDPAILAQITRMSVDAWSSAGRIVLAFFEQRDGLLVHKRIDQERAEANSNKSKKVAKAKAAAEVRWGKNAQSTATSINHGMHGDCPSSSPSPSPTGDNKNNSDGCFDDQCDDSAADIQIQGGKTKVDAVPKFDPKAALIAEGVDAQQAADFLLIRKAKKAPLTQTALDGLLREAAKAGVTAAGAVAICCERGWQGFKAEWVTEHRGQAQRQTATDQKFRPNASDYSSSNAAMARSMEQHGIKPGDLLDGNEIDF